MRFFIAILLSVVSLTLEAGECQLSYRTAAFFPQSGTIRDMYGTGVDYQLELNKRVSSCYGFWTNVGFVSETGDSEVLDDHTRMTIIPLNIGIKYYPSFLCCDSFHPYLGVGTGLSYIKFRDDSSFVTKNRESWGATLLTKTGVEIPFCCCYFLDVFFDYNWNFFHFCKREKCVEVRCPQTGGFKVGIGIGRTL